MAKAWFSLLSERRLDLSGNLNLEPGTGLKRCGYIDTARKEDRITISLEGQGDTRPLVQQTVLDHVIGQFGIIFQVHLRKDMRSVGTDSLDAQ